MMKILQLCNRIPWPLTDGGNIATWNLSHALENKGHLVTLACLNTQKHYQKHEVLTGKVSNYFCVDIDTSVHWIQAAKNILSPVPYIAERFISDDFKNALCRHLDEYTYDIIQIEGLYMAAYIKQIRTKSNAIIMFRAHNVEHKIWERLASTATLSPKSIYLHLMANSLKIYEIKMLNQADAVLFFTPQDQKSAIDAGLKVKSEIIPAGVDFPHIQGQLGIESPEIPIVGFLGSLDWQPNQDAVLWFVQEIFPLIRKSIPNVQFHLAGRNMPKDFLKGLNMEGIQYLGEIPDAWQFLQSLTCMVVPLRSGAGMRLKILEAMAAACPVISTYIGAEGIQALPDTHICIANDADQFAFQTLKVLQSQQVQRALSQNALKLMHDVYAWDKIADRTIQFYFQCLQN
jgi:polysaccharide biosynthesis protein PslH